LGRCPVEIRQKSEEQVKRLKKDKVKGNKAKGRRLKFKGKSKKK